jgi:CDP-diacylglycerol--glycerol-3-phosphate 3-phosphatidyltransferase
VKHRFSKHAANILTGLRIALTLMIPAFLNDRTLCVVLFATAGLTDVLDGVVARRTGTSSRLGARLDSLADMVMFGVMIACAVVWAGSALWAFVPYLIAVAAIRLANLAIAACRFRQFAIIHTWGNKLTGLLIFVGFGVYILTDSLTALIPVIAVAALAALEETVILITSAKLDVDRKSMLIKPKA